MADLDLQKQMADAAVERGGIAAALLAIQKSLDKMEPTVTRMEPVLASLEPKVADLAAWRPGVDHAVGQLQADLGEIRAELAKISARPFFHEAGKVGTSGIQSAADAPFVTNNTSGDGHGPDGHGRTPPVRVSGVGSSLLPPPTPANGMFRTPFPLVPLPGPGDSSGSVPVIRNSSSHLDCPDFDGDNPTGWHIRCEAYFRVCAIDPSTWVDTAIVHFTGAAALWLEWSQTHVKFPQWEYFVAAVLEKFGRSEFQHLVWKFTRLKQMGIVLEYAEQFNIAMHSLLAHHKSWDPLFFTTQFLDGLHSDIKAAVILHRPVDLETAVALASLQEEALELVRQDQMALAATNQQQPAARTYRASPRPPAPLTLPAAVSSGRTPSTPSASAEDRRSPDSTKPSAAPSSVDDKLKTLRAYRRARGLCFTCGERWGPGHVCASTVQLHVVEELVDMLHNPSSPDSNLSADTSEEDLCLLSAAAATGTESPKAFRLLGHLKQRSLLMLVDSGSSHSFINSDIAGDWPGIQTISTPLRVKVADGAIVSCTQEVPAVEYQVQGHNFQSPLKLFPLGAYDVILGMDWLESRGVMTVDWGRKHMKFTHNGADCQLSGIAANTTSCKLLSLEELNLMQARDEVAHVLQLCSVKLTPDGVDIPPEVQQLLSEFERLFEEPRGLPPTRSFDHFIELLPGAKPVNIRPYRYNPAQKDEIEALVSDMLKQGIIQPSRSPFASPVLLILKKNGEWRFCVDYRHLNAITVKNRYPLPIIDELLDELAGSAWFTSLDLRSGFHQIRMRPEDEAKTAFQTHHGHFEFKVMPNGVTGGPATFQSGMQIVLGPLLRKGVLVFIDDILIHSRTLSGHLLLLRSVFQLLDEHSLKIKQSKCVFAQPQLKYLGHVISSQGVSTDPATVDRVRDWPQPASVKELRQFLGLAGYYRKFVRHFGVISRPLTDLLKKGVVYAWTPLHEEAFQALKQALITAPVLALPDFSKQFVLETDASERGVGAVLMQGHHPIAFMSKTLGPKLQALSTYEKECLAILMAVDRWRSYLLPSSFVIRTDHRSLACLDEQRLTTPWQQKALTKLLGLHYTIEYRRGATNLAADALSRRRETPGHLHAVSVCVPKWLEEVKKGYVDDPQCTRLLTAAAMQTPIEAPFAVQDGIIRYKGRIWIGNNKSVQTQLLTEIHSGAIGGHSGIQATYSRIIRLFAWPQLKQTVKDFIALCAVCKQAKPEHVRYPGLLQPLEVPTQAWQVVTLDFVEGLPTSRGFNSILVVVDKLSRYAHFIPLHHPFTALQVAKAYMDFVFKLHGPPDAMVSDRDRIFTSRVWKELCKLTHTTLNISSARHPQTDGTTERVNQCMEIYLRCFAHNCPSKWMEWLSLAEFWYNTSYHSTLKSTPFEVLYGHKPRFFGISNVADAAVTDLAQWTGERATMVALLRQHLNRARQDMKLKADQKRSDRVFTMGDWVFLKLQPYAQSSVAARANHKLAFRFFGPFQVLQRVGEVAYKLALPEHAKIHPVIHVSQLRAGLPPATSAMPELPVLDEDLLPLQVPAAILQKRRVQRGPQQVKQVLVQWSAFPASLATWEDKIPLRSRFPRALAWGQAKPKGGGNVTGTTSSGKGKQAQEKPTRPQRPKQPNPRVVGPD